MMGVELQIVRVGRRRHVANVGPIEQAEQLGQECSRRYVSDPKAAGAPGHGRSRQPYAGGQDPGIESFSGHWCKPTST